MDPRRARDPRLARADPRLQRVQQDTPASTPTPPPAQPTSIENGYATPPNALAPYPADSLPSSSTPVPTVETPAYKQRPLFCVVCASNQVNPSSWSPSICFTRILEPFHGGTYGAVVRHARLILANYTDCND
jgi:hypothetical protein